MQETPQLSENGSFPLFASMPFFHTKKYLDITPIQCKIRLVLIWITYEKQLSLETTSNLPSRIFFINGGTSAKHNHKDQGITISIL